MKKVQITQTWTTSTSFDPDLYKLGNRLPEDAFSNTTFEYDGNVYITDKETLNEIFELLMNYEYDTLDLLIECSDNIHKL